MAEETDAPLHALFLPGLEPPPRQRVTEALTGLQLAGAVDAARICQSAHGVLLDGLTRAQAETVRQALPELELRIGEQAWLQPPARLLTRRATLQPRALVAHDVVRGDRTEVPWDDVILLSAGSFPEDASAVSSAQLEKRGRRRDEQELSKLVLEDDPAIRTASPARRVLDVVARGPVRRYRIEADRFDYRVLGERLQPSATRNFALLAREIMQRATGARHNPGMQRLLSEASQPQEYGSAQAFDRETSWLLWDIHDGELSRYERLQPQPSPVAELELSLQPDRSGHFSRALGSRWVRLAVELGLGAVVALLLLILAYC
ncbi:MAG: hypothetical protein PVI30_19160 [Myxococcales bacterium]|jgi:hypothetical protein